MVNIHRDRDWFKKKLRRYVTRNSAVNVEIRDRNSRALANKSILSSKESSKYLQCEDVYRSNCDYFLSAVTLPDYGGIFQVTQSEGTVGFIDLLCPEYNSFAKHICVHYSTYLCIDVLSTTLSS